MRLIRVNHTQADVQHRLNALQAVTLPDDIPCRYKPADLWWIVVENGEDIAYCAVRPLAHIEGWWYLARAGVVQEHQGKGIQTKMIRLRVSAAKAKGATTIITDTAYANLASSNSLINAGFKLYSPTSRWAFEDSLYWRKACSTST